MHHIFAIKDDKSGSFDKPVVVRSVHDFTRAIDQALKEGKVNFALYPQDFSVWRTGFWNEEQGTINGLESPEWMFSILSLLENLNSPTPLERNK